MKTCDVCGQILSGEVVQAAHLKTGWTMALCRLCFDHPAKGPDVVRIEDVPEGWEPTRQYRQAEMQLDSILDMLSEAIVRNPDYEPIEDAGPGSGKCETCPERLDCGLLAAWSAGRN